MCRSSSAIVAKQMPKATQDRPGIVRLRAMDMRPRLPTARGIIAAVVAVPKVQRTKRLPKIAPEQEVLF